MKQEISSVGGIQGKTHDLITADLGERWAGWERRRKMELEGGQLGMGQRPTWRSMTRSDGTAVHALSESLR